MIRGKIFKVVMAIILNRSAVFLLNTLTNQSERWKVRCWNLMWRTNINDSSACKLYFEALNIFAHKNLDFIDPILCAKSNTYEVKTFDQKLQKCINGKTN